MITPFYRKLWNGDFILGNFTQKSLTDKGKRCIIKLYKYI